ncbi:MULTISPECIES: CU044_5270 family protein [unclassified Streptomyces]|uniref:CU044_5270 family protein n=1 Tax=unclassified Streptomyces TaxID=2593676 RepID=UPI0034380BAA
MRDIEELRELREYDAGTPPLDDATRGRVRVRLLSTMNAENGPAAAVRHRRPFLRIALTGAVAAAVVGGVLVTGQDDDSGDGKTAAPPAASSPVMQNLSVQIVLNGAATYARRHEQAASPRDDQFIYTKEIIRETDEKTGATKTYTDEDWRSVDNSKPSWIMEIGKGWWSRPPQKNETVWPPQDWGTLKKLPTDPRKLILKLVHGRPGDKDDSLSGITDETWSLVQFKLAGLLKLVPVMPEGLRPAAYEALGMVPGVKAVPNQKDAKGRTGVAITYDDPTLPDGSASFGGSFIFDPKTYAFLGFRDARSLVRNKHRVQLTQLSYLDSWAIVDKAKQRP